MTVHEHISTNAELHAALEERDKREAQANLLSFYMRMTGFLPPRHIHKLCQLGQAMEEDRIDRAMCFMPPRHAKTLVLSQCLPAWIMGRNPKSLIMTATHTERYSKKVGGKVRNMLRSPKWPFPAVELSKDTTAKEAWTTTLGGEYNAFGMFGGNQHGNPAEWLIMDDIIKGRKIAMSPHMRDEAWETYQADLTTRLQGRRKQLIVFTRWHEDDPAGRILPDGFDGRSGWYQDRETGERWYVLSMPAVAEHDNDPLGRAEGEWLWPEMHGEKQLGARQKRGGFIWSALFQQRPSPAEGLLFKPEHIRRYEPGAIDLTRMQVYGSSDYAVTQDQESPDPDYTVHMIWAVDFDFNIYLLDIWRGRTLSDEWVRQFIRLARKYKPLRWVEEQGQIIKSVGPFLTTMMHKERVYVDRVQITPTEKKDQRAQSLLGMAAMGKMFLPSKAHLQPHQIKALDAFEKELLQFPGGRHDDTVDAATTFALLLDRIIEGQRPAPKIAPQGETLDELFQRYERNKRRDD